MVDAKRFAKGIKMLASTFRAEVDDLATEGYSIALAELNDEQFTSAVRKALLHGQRMPTPAELRSLAGVGGAKSLKAEAAEAWERVQDAMDEGGEDDGADFGTIANAVVRNLGGWSVVWNEPFKARPFLRRKFEELYEAFAENAPSLERGAPLLPRGGRMFKRLPPGTSPSPFAAAVGPVSPLVRELAEAKKA